MLDDFIGGSPASQKLRTAFPKLAQLSNPIILIGEGGVGKTLAARHIHACSARSSSPIETLNFSLLSERDQRILLFGAEPPEISSCRRGVLEESTTVVLKRINTANSFIQDTLACALQTNTVSRLRSSERHAVQAKIILTFRKPLIEHHRKGKLSNELFCALKPCKSLTIPPLRQRKEDIPMIAEYYLKKWLSRYSTPDSLTIRGYSNSVGLDPSLRELMMNQRWQDNVRDLIAFLRSLLLLKHEDEVLQSEKLLVMKLLAMLEERIEFSLPNALDDLRELIINRTLSLFDHHKTNAAQFLGISDRALRRNN